LEKINKKQMILSRLTEMTVSSNKTSDFQKAKIASTLKTPSTRAWTKGLARGLSA
jgi:hypothetical protein